MTLKTPALKFLILHRDSVNLKLSAGASLAGTSPSLGPAVSEAAWSLMLYSSQPPGWDIPSHMACSDRPPQAPCPTLIVRTLAPTGFGRLRASRTRVPVALSWDRRKGKARRLEDTQGQFFRPNSTLSRQRPLPPTWPRCPRPQPSSGLGGCLSKRASQEETLEPGLEGQDRGEAQDRWAG